jgi:ABC-type phosphate/phosphonate transport system substrate-binding protein
VQRVDDDKMASRRALAYRGPIRLLVPPSTEAVPARHLPELVAALGDAVPGLVAEVATDDASLGDAVVAGRRDAAWVPPIVGARVEVAGGRVVRRAVRHGTTRYRAGLVCRRGRDLRSLAALAGG